MYINYKREAASDGSALGQLFVVGLVARPTGPANNLMVEGLKG